MYIVHRVPTDITAPHRDIPVTEKRHIVEETILGSVPLFTTQTLSCLEGESLLSKKDKYYDCSSSVRMKQSSRLLINIFVAADT